MSASIRRYAWIAWFAAVATATAQPETAEQYQQRTGRFYETEYLPKAVAQASRRAGLTEKEAARLSGAFREHVYRYLDEYAKTSCFTRSDWQRLLDRFDRSVANVLPPDKAAAVAAWRNKPWPEGNALGFLFFSPWMSFAELDAAVTMKSSRQAIDCGFRTVSSACAVDQCVLDAIRKRTPFRAMYEERGVDSRLARGIVGAADGTGVVLHWDSMGGRITERACRFRIGRSLHGGEHVDCQ